jgi:tetratricopeptide (TPR) repeat protein
VDLELDPLLIERRRKARKRFVLACIAFVACGIVAWQWPAIRDRARAWRSVHLAGSAEEYIAKGDLLKAFEKAQAAYYLKPDEPRAMRAVATIMDQGGRYGEALPFWRSLASSSGSTPDRLALAEDLLRTGAITEASNVVATLRATSPRSGPVLRLSARLAAAQGRLPEALAMARESLEVEPNHPEGRLLAATFLAQGQEALERQAAFDELWSLSNEQGAIGTRALEMLGRWPKIPPDREPELLRRLRERPMPDERFKFLAVEVTLRLHPGEKAKILDELVAEYRTKDAELRKECAVWLNQQGALEKTLELLPEEECMTRKDLLLVRLDALSPMNRWADVRRILELRTVPLEEVYRQAFLARCAAQEGDATEAESHWRRARIEAGNDARLLGFVGEYAERAGELKQAESVYKALARNAVNSRPAYDALLRVVARSSETREVRDVLVEMNKAFPEDAAIENDLAYFNLLLNENVEDASASARKLRTAAPGNLAHRTTLALAYCRQNEPAEALRAYDGLDVPWGRVPPSQRAVHAAVLALNGEVDPAKKEIAELSLSELRPEEKKLIDPWIAP